LIPEAARQLAPLDESPSAGSGPVDATRGSDQNLPDNSQTQRKRKNPRLGHQRFVFYLKAASTNVSVMSRCLRRRVARRSNP